MKGTEIFKQTILNYLENRAASDGLFAQAYAKPGKDIDACITYILTCVQKSQCNGFDDSQIYNMAVHFYDEDDIEVGNLLDCDVFVNHFVELTPQEKEQARKDAIQRAQDEAYKEMTKPVKKTKKERTVVNTQPSLFDF